MAAPAWLTLALLASAAAPSAPLPYFLQNSKVVQGLLREDMHTGWTAAAEYSETLNTTGWDVLKIRTNPKLSDEEQMFEAGKLEGYLTHQSIYYMWYNNIKDFCINKTEECKKTERFLKANWNYTSNFAKNNLGDPYWYQVHLLYQQIRGIYQGYNDANEASKKTNQKLSEFHIIWLNSLMDVGADLIYAFQNETEEDFMKHLGHCSALVKLLPDFSDVYFGHDTWSEYSNMNRIFKTYYFPIRKYKGSNELIPGVEMKFSSYPGVISSVDDFYVISSGLATMETTNNVYNYSIYSAIVADSVVLEGIRSMLANRLASNSSEWAQYFARNNSGTYNNQWMIIDLNRFSPGFQPKSNFFWVVEQMPGLVVAHDQTDLLIGRTYFASYNIPFYEEIYNYSGLAQLNRKYEHLLINKTLTPNYPNPFSHGNCPRAKIFKREQSKVKGLRTMYNLLRLNSYRNDPYSVCLFANPIHNPSLSISARDDLFPMNGKHSYPCSGFSYFGAIDVKISSYLMYKNGETVLAESGPTASGGEIPVFTWSNTKYEYRMGQPDTWAFPPQQFSNGEVAILQWGRYPEYITTAQASTTFISSLHLVVTLILIKIFY